MRWPPPPSGRPLGRYNRIGTAAFHRFRSAFRPYQRRIAKLTRGRSWSWPNLGRQVAARAAGQTALGANPTQLGNKIVPFLAASAGGDVHREAAERGLLVLCLHVVTGLAHSLDDFVEGD